MSQYTTRLSRRGFLRAAGGVSAVALLAACAPMTVPAATDSGASAEARSLTIWAHRSFAPPADDVLLANIDKWGADNGVELEVIAEIEVPTMDQRFAAAVESKVLPDVTAISGGRVALYYPANIYVDVSELYQELGTEYGGFFRPAEQTALIEDKYWVIPYSCDTSLMYYRMDILEEKGIAIPTTWQEYADNMLAAQTPPDVYGSGIALNKAATDGESTLSMMLYSFGSSYVLEDGQTININNQGTRDMLNFFVEQIYNREIIPPGAFEWDNAANNAAYQDESAVSINNPASVLVWLLENKPEIADVTAIQALPAGPEGSFSSAGVRVAWALMNTSAADKQELGMDFVRDMMLPENYEPWISLAFAAPSTNKYEEMALWEDPKRAGFLNAAKNGVLGGYPGPITPASSELGTLVPTMSMVLRMIVDGWTVDEAVEEAEQVATDVYSKHFS